MHTMTLPADYALVLQHIEAEGEEDFTDLAESLHYNHGRLSHIIHALQHKGQVRIKRQYDNGWVSLSSRGRRLVEALWAPQRFIVRYN
jgi:DNA-binding MarR family transcriptional regulator